MGLFFFFETYRMGHWDILKFNFGKIDDLILKLSLMDQVHPSTFKLANQTHPYVKLMQKGFFYSWLHVEEQKI
jgi:hypothetical protein